MTVEIDGSNLPISVAAQLWCEDIDMGSEEADEEVRVYKTSMLRKSIFIVACVIVTFLVAGISLTLGSVDLSVMDCYTIVWDHITGNIQNKLYDYIIVNERLSRIFTSVVAGAGLAICGCVMQSVLKNPLADPYTTGISSGAGFGATLAFTLGISIVGGDYAVVINAFVFSLIPTLAIIGVSRLKGASPTTMIMAGLAIMFIFNAFTTLFKLMADPDALAALYEWQVGSVAKTDWNDILIMLVVTIIGAVIVQAMAKNINVLSTGDESAKSMGIDVETLRILLLMVISLVVASIVSFTGLIGFVGLVCPHICRMFVGSDNRYLILSSAMLGSTLLVVADVIGRTIIAPATLQVGVVTAFIGGPMFLYLILRQKKEAW